MASFNCRTRLILLFFHFTWATHRRGWVMFLGLSAISSSNLAGSDSDPDASHFLLCHLQMRVLIWRKWWKEFLLCRRHMIMKMLQNGAKKNPSWSAAGGQAACVEGNEHKISCQLTIVLCNGSSSQDFFLIYKRTNWHSRQSVQDWRS